VREARGSHSRAPGSRHFNAPPHSAQTTEAACTTIVVLPASEHASAYDMIELILAKRVSVDEGEKKKSHKMKPLL
jgi:hypothetical protein